MQQTVVQRLSKHVITILGLNPSPFTLNGTNTYLVGQGKNRILIDTGEGVEEYSKHLARVLEENDCRISAVLITHHHRDHVGGIGQVFDLSGEARPVVRKLPNAEDSETEKRFQFKYGEPLKHGEVVRGEDFSLQVYEMRGHCADHVCFYLHEEKTFLSGDFILGGSSSVVTDMCQQFKSYEEALKIEVENIYPAHGAPIFGAEKCQQEIQKNYQHRVAREQQIIGALKDSAAQNGEHALTIQKLRERVYPDLANAMLVYGAENNIKRHLEKLIQEEKVKNIADDTYALNFNKL